MDLHNLKKVNYIIEFKLFNIIDCIFKLDLLSNGKDIEYLVTYLLEKEILDDNENIVIMPNTNTSDVYINYDYIIKNNKFPLLIIHLIDYFLDLWNYPKNIFLNELDLALDNRKEGLDKNIDNYLELDSYIDLNYTSDEVFKLIELIDALVCEALPDNSLFLFEDIHYKNYNGKRLRNNYLNFMDYYLMNVVSNNTEPLKDTKLGEDDKQHAFKNSISFIKDNIELFNIDGELKNDFYYFLDIEIVKNKIDRIATFKDRYYYREAIFKGLSKINANYILKYENINFYPVVVDMIISYFELIIFFKSINKISRHHRKKLPNNILSFYKDIKEQQLKPYLINCFDKFLENDFKETKELMKKFYYTDPKTQKRTPLYQQLPLEVIKILKYSEKIL